MNRGANIARDPISKSAYFLSLIDGPAVEAWLFKQSEWLDRAEAEQRSTAWQELEQKFKTDFFDYAGPEIASLEISKLRMKDGNVDKYITDFEALAHRAGYNVDDLSTLHMFRQGLPARLAENCIRYESTDTFEQWTKAAQRRQNIWLKKQSHQKDRDARYASQPPSNRARQNHEGNAQGQSGRPGTPTHQSTSQDPNARAMDASGATARRAMSDAEKQKHFQEGRCFECSKQGHFARDCRKKRHAT
jgi:hypothetical protein